MLANSIVPPHNLRVTVVNTGEGNLLGGQPCPWGVGDVDCEFVKVDLDYTVLSIKLWCI